MIHVALFEPAIPPNTGNIGRLCAAVGSPLHLVGDVKFGMTDKDLLRAGCDYWPHMELHQHATLEAFEAAFPGRIICLSAHAKLSYTRIAYQAGDCLLFGNEARGLPPEVLARHAALAVTIPMPTGKVRSINLATAAGIVLYEALRQLHNW